MTYFDHTLHKNACQHDLTTGMGNSLFFDGRGYAIHYVLSSFAITLTMKRAGCFAFIVFWMSCYCKCPVTLLRGAVEWSAVCDCDIS